MKEEFDLKLSSYFGKKINVEIIESLSCECDKVLKKQSEEIFERVKIWLGTLFIEEFMNKKVQERFQKEHKRW